ncbi:MAG: GNAT family N-acetyltransferase [Ferruginibacter sp.]
MHKKTMDPSAEFQLIDYSPEHKDAIKELNYEWLEKYFFVEPNDIKQLNNPEEEIIEKGGAIYYVKHKNQIVGTVSLMQKAEQVYELSKMAVTATFQGKGISNLLMDKCILAAKIMGAKKLILYSNTKLANAISLYKKYGFTEIPLDNSYARSNIKMEKIL